MEQTNEIYRVQNSKIEEPDYTQQAPLKRVLVANDGQIALNPNQEQFIYFSRTRKHHAYYMLNKIFRIIVSEIEKAKRNPYFAKLDLPDDFRAFTYYAYLNINSVKQAKNLFENYLPTQKLELITLKTIHTFNELFEACSIDNHLKTFGKNYPEVSDLSTFGGAYGINDLWLQLMRQCTTSSSVCTITAVSILEKLLECKHLIKVDSQRLKYVFGKNEALFSILDNLPYSTYSNPNFYDKNTINLITQILEKIEREHCYNPSLNLNHQFFLSQRREIKNNIHDVLENS